MSHTSRRNFVRSAGAVATVGIAGCAGGDGGSTPTGAATTAGGSGGTRVTTMLPAGDVYNVWGEASLQQGFFEEQGLDLTIEYKPFPAYIQSLTSGEIDVGLMSTMPYVQFYNNGEDLVTFGWSGGLQGISGLYALAESDYQSIEDLTGETIGVWSWGSSTVQSFQALVAEIAGLRLREDFQTTTAAPPALQGLLDKGDIQGAIEIASFSIAMRARPEQYRRIAQLNGMWQERTGNYLPLVSWFSYADWYEENGDIAAGLVAGAAAATEHWRENTMAILDEFGDVANITSQAKKEVVAGWANDGQIFVADADRALVDSTWEYLGLLEKYGFLDSLPDQSEIVRTP